MYIYIKCYSLGNVSAHSFKHHIKLFLLLDCMPQYDVGLNPSQGLWNLSCKEAIQLVYGTSVVLLRCPLVPEIMRGTQGLPPTVKAGKSP